MKNLTRPNLLILLVALFPLLASMGGCAVQKEVAYINGLQAYVYGFPLVMMDATREKTTAVPKAGEYGAPMNQFARIRTLVNPDYKDVVRISRNSIWTFGFVDLENEAFVYSQPDTKGRYIVMQALNMWTDDFASVGTRTPGNQAGNFLIVGPKWNGTAPTDVKGVYRSSTRYAWVLVQIACAGPQEYAEVNALQDQLKLTPLSAWGKPYTPPEIVPVDPLADTTQTPYDSVRLMTGEMFFTRLAKCLKDNPPYPEDKKALGWLKGIGIEPGKDFDPSKLDPAVRAGINKVPAEVWTLLAQGPYTAPNVNGWLNMLNLGRYGTDYETRALIAYAGLGALTSDDAIYPSAFVDGDGKVLDGAAKYVMHFEKGQLPPSKCGVWSISQYRENFYVHNPIERYAISSAMPLKFNSDGSLDIYIQRFSPGPDKESNWLPTPPTDPFNLTVRIYQPEKSALDGTYKLPPVKRVN